MSNGNRSFNNSSSPRPSWRSDLSRLDLSLQDIPPPPRAFEDKYVIRGVLAQGTYGVVHVARDKETGHTVVAKSFKDLSEQHGFPITTLRELMVLQTINKLPASERRHLVPLLDIRPSRDWSDTFAIFPFIEHSLSGLLKHFDFRPGDIQWIFKQVVHAVNTLHRQHIIHRDLKPSNVLLNNEGNVVVCDFGLAFSTTNMRKRVTPRLIAMDYRPPEMLCGSVNYTFDVDIWSLGCLLVHLYTLNPPFLFRVNGEKGSNMEQLTFIANTMGLDSADLITDQIRKDVPENERHFLPVTEYRRAYTMIQSALLRTEFYRASRPQCKPDADALDAILDMLHPDPLKRPNIEQVLAMPFVHKAIQPATFALRLKKLQRYAHA